MSGPPTPPTTCIDCDQKASEPCAYCKQLVCDAHVQASRKAADTLFGPAFMPADVRVCQLCYGERLWLAGRALLILVGGALTVGTVALKLWPAIPLLWVLIGGTWWLGGRYIQSYRDRREARRSA